ncbi:hypothetical protein BRD00_05180 [Halobacteriales archaeon QS_8_69_26]|nr:MAG: hypothetical protein BRD00_05180 [Halobacteriales archaeon QS_8_69_26]
MKEYLSAIATAAGAGLVLLGLAITVAFGPWRIGRAGGAVFGTMFVLAAFVVVVWKVWGSLDWASGQPVPWAEDEEFATPAPERSREEFPLSSDYFARRTSEAGDTARSEGTVDDGIAVLRPELRETLVAVLVGGSHDEASAEHAVETGAWTDDPVATAVVEPGLEMPETSIRRRIEAWLFPERVLRERVRRTVQKIAETADGSLPTVPGQSAPRTVPVLEPRLEELQRGADGRLQRAVDPTVVGPDDDPPTPDEASGDPDGPAPGSAGADAGRSRANSPATADGPESEPTPTPDGGDEEVWGA